MDRRGAGVLLSACVALGACGGGSDDGGSSASTSTPAANTETTAPPGPDGTEDPAVTEAGSTVRVGIDVAAPGAEISPLILGISGKLDVPEMQDAGVTLESWGGNPSTRYNYQVGNLWNSASDFEYRNTNYGSEGDVFRRHAEDNAAAGIATRLAVPTLGWISKDDTSCSFPDDDGGCLGDEDADCEEPGPIADPTRTSIESTPAMVASWVADLFAEGIGPQFIAMDNEPELWGFTHYDVHPECTTYEEIRDTFLEYATSIREVAPEAELTGPVMCCWYDYWNIAPGPADGSDTDFLTWFLREVRAHDESTGIKTLDVVDVHFYPQSDVFNDETDEETNARRLRSVRALWDPEYGDESWIPEAIEFIPRMQRTIEANYPGLPLMISEWNFGADTTMNGALAIADVLGVYGQEGVYAAAYWRSPDAGSPGYYAFKMHGNYDGEGSRFGGLTLPVNNLDVGTAGVYATLDEAAGLVRVLLINKDPDEATDVELTGLPAVTADRWTYGPDEPAAIVTGTADLAAPVRLPPASITVLEVPLDGATVP